MALTSIGPTTLNIVVPALPNLANRLASDVGTIQLIVSIYLLAMAAGQLLMGSLSDRFGRRPVLIVALSVTAGASVSAVLISTVESLIAARLPHRLAEEDAARLVGTSRRTLVRRLAEAGYKTRPTTSQILTVIDAQ